MVKSEEDKVKSIAKNIRALHKKKPSIIFLTETSAIPDGYAFKEAWRTAYPDEKPPVFYRIDPRALCNIREFHDKISLTYHTEEGRTKFERYKEIVEKNQLMLEAFLKRRIKDRSVVVFIYDEDSITGSSPSIVYDLLTNPKYFGLQESLKCENVHMVLGYHEAQKLNADYFAGTGLSPRITKKKKLDAFPFDRIELRGTIDRSDRKRNLNAIKSFKYLGRKAGEEIQQEEQKKKSLEHRVSSVIALGSFLASALFLSSKITGNAIADITTKTSSFLGAGFLILGLVAGFFWLKSRKK
ncbi:MAG: hypothetical protein AABW75_01120 [Nanoarchaeota archaeon]